MEKMESLLYVTSSPHAHSGNSISIAMRDVLLALVPAFLAALYFFGWQAAGVIITSVVTAIACEYLCQRVMKRDVTVSDYSAALTGLLLAFTLPAGLPLWMVAIGSISAIVLGKQFFGGLGGNIFNPALVGRAVLLASWPVAMTTWPIPLDASTGATPLGIIKETGSLADIPTLSQMLIGNTGGSLGETSALALILGGIFLIWKKHIDWRIPVTFIASVFLLSLVIGLTNGVGARFALIQILSGGLLLGAFFMATDWVSTPITSTGRIIFGLGCGLITILIRTKGGYPEGVCYSILLMNGVTPLIDRFTTTRVFGEVLKSA